MSTAEHVAISLLAMAETLRTQQPPKFKMAIKCVMACFKQQLNDHMNALCNFELGKLYYFYTENQQTAKDHLELSYSMMSQIGDLFKEHRLQALCLICEIYISMNHGSAMLSYLKTELTVAKQFYPHIHSKMLLLYTEICALEENTSGALQAIDMGISSGDTLTQIYFKLTKHLVNARFSGTRIEATDAASVSQMIQSLPSESPHTANVRLFLIATQLAHNLSGGQSRSAKPLLRQMQQEVQNLANVPAPGSGLLWGETTALTILACVMTVISSALICSVERAHKYYGIATKHLSDVARRSAHRAHEPGISRALDKMKLVLDEVMTHLNIVSCHPTEAISNVRSMVETSSKSIVLSNEFHPIIHVLLGQYGVYANEPQNAEKHFVIAVKSIKDRSQYVLANLNLALFYLTQGKTAEYYDIVDRITLRQCESMSIMVRAAARMVHAYQCYLFNKPSEFKQFAMECLEFTRTEDMSRLHTLSLLLFSQLCPVAITAIPPTLQTSKKSEDHSWLMWTYKMLQENASAIEGVNLEEIRAGWDAARNGLEAGRRAAEDNQLHSLLQWEDGDPMVFIPNE